MSAGGCPERTRTGPAPRGVRVEVRGEAAAWTRTGPAPGGGRAEVREVARRTTPRPAPGSLATAGDEMRVATQRAGGGGRHGDMTRPLSVQLASQPVPLGHHLIMRLTGDVLIADTPARRRVLARTVLEHTLDHGLFTFRASDTHLHLGLTVDRVTAGRVARTLGGALRTRLGHEVAFEPTRYRVIQTQRHLGNTFFYALRQEETHGIDADPLHDGSCLPDLLGARILLRRGPRRRSAVRAGAHVEVLGFTLAAHVRRRLPRITRAMLLELVGGEAMLEAPPALGELADAAAAALGLAHLEDDDHACHLARLAGVHAARGKLDTRSIAGALGTSTRHVVRLAGTACPAPLVRAVDLQMRMRSVRRSSSLAAE